MITRRNLLLKCSIFVNVAVLLYICSHVMVGNNTNNFGMSGTGSSSYLIQLPTSHQQSTQQQKSSLSPAQVLQDEQELAAILKNKEMELQKQIKLQEAAQVSITTSLDIKIPCTTLRSHQEQGHRCKLHHDENVSLPIVSSNETNFASNECARSFKSLIG